MERFKVGDKYVCLKDYVMDNGETAFEKGKVYKVLDFMDDWGWFYSNTGNHQMQNDEEFNEYFDLEEKKPKIMELDTHDDNNPNHPANREENPVFESNDLQECLDHARETKDFEPLENAIAHNELVKQMVNEDLTEVIKLFRSKGFDATANFLCKTRDKLK